MFLDGSGIWVQEMRVNTVLAVGSLVLLTSMLLAQSSPTLIVVVEDSNGAPIAGASVQVQHWATPVGSKPRMVQDGVSVTDSQGRASFEVAPQEYEVFASAPAFVPAVAGVQAPSVKALRGRELRHDVDERCRRDRQLHADPSRIHVAAVAHVRAVAVRLGSNRDGLIHYVLLREVPSLVGVVRYGGADMPDLWRELRGRDVLSTRRCSAVGRPR